jgi:hypothetical protein
LGGFSRGDLFWLHVSFPVLFALRRLARHGAADVVCGDWRLHGWLFVLVASCSKCVA